MHHKAVIKLGTHDHLQYNIQCACGTGGDFGSKEEAMNWMTMNHFRSLQGINTAEFVDETPSAKVPEAAPKEEETKAEPTPPEPPEPEQESEVEEQAEAEEKPKKKRSVR